MIGSPHHTIRLACKIALFLPVSGSHVVPLIGPWRLALDRGDIGRREHWHERRLEGSIELPGALAQRGFGDPVALATTWTGSIFDPSYFDSPDYAPYRQPGNIKVPFWLQPELHYAGAAGYQREIEIPAAWQRRRIVLHLERAHRETRAWLDGRALGGNGSLGTPHDYDLGTAVEPGPTRSPCGCPGARDDHRLPRVHRRAHRAGGQPRDRPVVRVSGLC